MAIFGLLPFQGGDALLQPGDQPFEDLDPLLIQANGQHGFFETSVQLLLRLLSLCQGVVFAPQGFH